jgi:hypothetical protein
MKTAKFDYNGEIAELRENNGVVEVIRGGNTTPFKHSFEQVVKTFLDSGWVQLPEEPATPAPELLAQPVPAPADAQATLEEQLAMQSAAKQDIPLSLQKEIDEYIEVNAEKAKLDSKLKKLKESVRGYMDDKELKKLQGTHGKAIVLEDAKATNSTSTFSDYHLVDITGVLEEEQVKEVTELRVNTKKLEALLAAGKLPSATVKTVKGLKIAEMGTPRFKVKNN